MQIRSIEAQKKRPVGLMVAAGFLVVLVAGLGIFLYNKNEESEAQDRRIAAITDAIDKNQAELKDLVDEQEKRYQELLAAKTEEEKQAAEAALAEAKRKRRAKEEALSKLKNTLRSTKGSGQRGSSGGGEKEPAISKPKCDPSDPLCGI
jgi:hypothetical protein